MNYRILILLFFSSALFHIYGQDRDKLLPEAMNAYHNKLYSKAYEIFEKVRSDSPNLMEEELAAFYSADCLLALGITDGAIHGYEFFVKNYKTSAYRSLSLYKLGILLFHNESYSPAIEKFMRLIADYPGSEYSGNAYYWIGESFAQGDKYYEAEDYLLKAYENNKEEKYADYSLFALSKIYEKSQKYDKAVEYYDELLSYYWDSDLAPLAQLRIGLCYFQLKDYHNAVLELSDSLIVNLSPREKYQADYLLANSFFRLREYGEAKDLYNEIISDKAEESKRDILEYGLAWVNFQLQDYDNAYGTFSRLSSSANDTLAAASLYWSAECKRYSGDVDLAMNILERYLDRYPRHYLAPTARYNIALIYFEKDNFGRAEEFLLNVIQVEEKTLKSKGYILLGEISSYRGDFENAEDYFLRAKDLSLMNDNLRNRASLGLGAAYYFQEEFREAVNILNEVNSKFHSFEKEKVNFYLAEAHFALGNYEAALRHYLRVSSRDKNLSKQVLYGKAYTYYNLKDFSNAAYFFSEFTKNYSSDEKYTDAKLRLADSYYGLKDFDSASSIYNSLFNREGRNVDDDFAYYQYGQALFKSGQYTRAINEFASLQRRFRRSKYNDDSQYVIGWIYFQNGEFENSIASYRDLLDRYPRSPLKPIAYYSIGDAYFNMGDYESAITSYTLIINEFPQTQYVYDAINGIQYCYIALDTPDRAVDLIDSFISSNPGYAFSDQILFKKGEIYYSLGEYEKSMGGYKEFIRNFPESNLIPNAYFWIGKCEQILDRPDEALANFIYVYENFLQAEYGVSSVLEIGKIKIERGELNDVVEIYEDVIGKLPASARLPELMFNKGVVLVEAGETQKAYQTFYDITQNFTESIFTEKSKIELGILELANERYESASRLFNEVGENRTDDIGAKAQYYYGLSLMKQENLYDAITVFVRVRSVFPGYDEWYTNALLSLGDCYVKLGEKKEAREMFRAVLRRHSNDDFADIAKQKLNEL